jgi:hypothetical protein
MLLITKPNTTPTIKRISMTLFHFLYWLVPFGCGLFIISLIYLMSVRNLILTSLRVLEAAELKEEDMPMV